MSFRLFVKLAAGNPAPFVFMYSTGNVMSLMSSVFLSGPGRQFRLMFDEKRRTTSVAYLSALASSIAVCLVPLPTGLRIGLLVSREYRGGLHSFYYLIVFFRGNPIVYSRNPPPNEPHRILFLFLASLFYVHSLVCAVLLVQSEFCLDK